ncbi:hypothetical protein Tco_1547568 [Tanacetum coccineum]
MLVMVVDLQEGHQILKESLLRVKICRLRLGMEMYKELYDLLHQKMLYMFSATNAMLKNYEVEVILSDEQNNFLRADVAQMEELKI